MPKSLPEPPQPIDGLLEYCKQTRGIDLSAYKRASLSRRIEKRMAMVGVESPDAYVQYLEAHPDEFTALFNTILINVTGFFRDKDPWDYLTSNIIPFILSTKKSRDAIRIWSAGCATGQEAYSIAMLMAEAIGSDQVRERVKIYATDADEEALNTARMAVYQQREVEGVPEEYLGRYFESHGERYSFHKELRRSVIFGRHDLIQDAPISRIDLLICRNTLMYFNAEAQARVLARFHFALHDGSFLLLGKAETLLTHASTFSPVDLRRRVFAKVSRGGMREDRRQAAAASSEPVLTSLVQNARLREAAVELGPAPQLVVDNLGTLMLVNQQARALFGLTNRDLGRPFRDLEIFYRPVELRSLIEQAAADRRPLALKEVEWPNGSGEMRFLDVEVAPLSDLSSLSLGTSVSFTDVTRYRHLQTELQHANQELETTMEELQSTNEELETTNEELQSTVEELETTNEELQSTNEELETMNEELQSTNEELQTMNDEMRQRGIDLNKVNSLLESVLRSLHGGVIVVDTDLGVVVWNNQSEELWGLRSQEAKGKHLLNLDIGLPVEQLKQPMRVALARETEEQEIVLNCTNRRGKAVRCCVRLAPLLPADASPGDNARGVIMMVEVIEDA